MRTWCCFLLLTMACTPLRARQRSSYVLNGTINVDTGTIRMIFYLSKDFYPFDTVVKKTTIRHGRFSFSGYIGSPSPYILSLNDPDYLSGEFFVEPGVQHITCEKDSMRVIPLVNNKSTKELRAEYKQALIGYRDRNAKAEIAAAYVRSHQGSYVALLELARDIGSGYLNTYDTVFAQFHDGMKNSVEGKLVRKELDAARRTGIGRTFPEIAVLDTTLTPVELSLKKAAHKYTLIDFWFSHCAPCLGQFPRLRKIYETTKRSELEIIGISIDKENAVADWKKVISEKGLGWPQYLDIDGKAADELKLRGYPNNFLLDEHNVIIKKDVSPGELEQMMK